MTKVTHDKGVVTVEQGGVVAVTLTEVDGGVVAAWWDVPPIPFALPPPTLVADGAGAAVPVRRVAVADGTRLLLAGSEASDDVNGGSGADTLNGAGGDDFLWGRDGNDVLSGGAGRDRLWGDRGADSLSGGVDADWLYGGAGADTLEGGAGQDYLEGGTGADVFRLRRSDAGARPDLEFSDWVADFARTEGDVIELVGFAPGATVRHSGEGYYEVLEGDAVAAKVHVTRTGTDAAGKPVAIAITDLGPGDFVFLGSVAPPGAPPAPAPAPAPRPVVTRAEPPVEPGAAILAAAPAGEPLFGFDDPGIVMLPRTDGVPGDSWPLAPATGGEDQGWALI